MSKIDTSTMSQDEINALIEAGIIDQDDIVEQSQIEQQGTQQQAQYEDPYGLLRGAESTLGGLETLRTLATGIVADPIAKVVDIASTPFAGVEKGTEYGNVTRDFIMKQPVTPKGKEYVGRTAEFLKPVEQVFKAIGGGIKTGVETATGSEVAGEMTKDIASLIPDLLGLKIGAKIAKPIPLKNADGSPTRELKALLARKGFTYDGLTPEAQAAIPAVWTGSKASEAVPAIASRAEYEAGGRGRSQAEFEPETASRTGFTGGAQTSKVDPVGQEALRQGWNQRFIGLVKTASGATRAEMQKMLQSYNNWLDNSSWSPNVGRPSDYAGDAVVSRLIFLKDKVDDAAIVLDDLAKNVLVGMPVDARRVAERLATSLENIGVRVEQNPKTGAWEPQFEGSKITVDPTSKRVVKDTIKALMESGTDAAGLHALKGKLDGLINYRKSAANKLTKDGERVVKALRAEVNAVLREASPEYARVNDTLSKGLKAFEDLDDATGSGVKLFEETANQTIGQELRKLFSNQQNRVALGEALGNLENTAKAFAQGSDSKTVAQISGQARGPRQTAVPNFDVNAADLAQFAFNLDDRITPVAEKSFAGDVGSSVKRGVRGAIDPTGTSVWADVGQAIVNRMGEQRAPVTDATAIDILEQLVKRNGQ